MIDPTTLPEGTYIEDGFIIEGDEAWLPDQWEAELRQREERKASQARYNARWRRNRVTGKVSREPASLDARPAPAERTMSRREALRISPRLLQGQPEQEVAP